MGNPNATLGCDFSGTVESVGDDVVTVKVGDKVCGMIHGGKLPERGSFAEYLVTKGECAMKIPSGMSDADAATFGVGYFTAAMVCRAVTALLEAQAYS
jgi:NADPH:quinone reductase-like Zn-dependent oxidoreductase